MATITATTTTKMTKANNPTPPSRTPRRRPHNTTARPAKRATGPVNDSSQLIDIFSRITITTSQDNNSSQINNRTPRIQNNNNIKNVRRHNNNRTNNNDNGNRVRIHDNKTNANRNNNNRNYSIRSNNTTGSSTATQQHRPRHSQHHQQVRQIQPGSNSSGSENEDHRTGHVAPSVEEPQESDWDAFSHAILNSSRPAATAVKDARVPVTVANAYVVSTKDANTSSNTNNHQNSIPRCSGTTVGQTPCERPGKNTVTEYNQVRYYCRQHDPRLADHRCLGYVASERRQCLNTCSVKEIRPDGRPICNTHIRPGARLISRA